jgi:hypothetical protein
MEESKGRGKIFIDLALFWVVNVFSDKQALP